MKIFSWNIRGLNSSDRQRTVRSWILSQQPVIGAFLETHVREENASNIVHSVVPGWRCEDNYQEADGGRIWVVWDPNISVLIFKKSAQSITCGAFDRVTGLAFTVIFVYAFNTAVQRQELWSELNEICNLRVVQNQPTLVMGDFNQILTADEHYSVSPFTLPVSGMEEFQDCLSSSELEDIESRGTIFTWGNGQLDEPILRKLDRALGNQCWRDNFPDVFAFFDAPGDSDHSPCVVNLNTILRTRKCSFKYFSFLATHPKFLETIKSAWEEEIPVGSKLFSLGQKLNHAKKACRRLNKEGFRNIQQRARDALSKLQEVQIRLLTQPTDTLFREEFVARKEWRFFEKAEGIFFKRKSRVRWLSLGDANTTFYHNSCIAHQARNAIQYLIDDNNQRVDQKEAVKSLAAEYFQNLLGQENAEVQPFSVEELKSIIPYRFPQEWTDDFIAPPSAEEITAVIFGMPKSKAPGPDGFPAEFFWEAWSVVGSDTIAAVQEFFSGNRMLRRSNATTIALLAKVTGADMMTQFRPISLCSSIYKVIVRIIKNSLRRVIPETVQLNQAGFVQGRLLCENVLLATELVADFDEQGDTTRGCLKVDLSKAYDNVHWGFLDNLLQAMELPPQFREWIRECVTTTSFSISLNGELAGYFGGRRGLRQSDPISSLLFVLIMDVLSRMLDKGAIDNMFRLHPRCHAPLVTHLSFADDVLVFFDGSEESLRGILGIMEDFKNISGLYMNRQKTELLIDGGSNIRCRELAERVGITQGSLPVKYLGVPLSSRKMKRTDFQPLLDKVSTRFRSWTIRHLSFAGRLVLVKTVIFAIITFWASIFILPQDCVEALERMCNGFLWKGDPSSARGAKISWVSVCTPTICGGLGLKRIAHWNKVLALKLVWLIFSENFSLWSSWIRVNMIGSNDFWTLDVRRHDSWIWKSICSLREVARQFLVCEIGSGITASFWQDSWTSLGPLI